MKNLIIIFFLSFALTSCGQKKLPIKEIAAVDGDEYEYILLPKQDSLRWYNPGQDTFRIKVTFEKLSSGFPLPDLITDIDNALDEAHTIKYTPQSFSGDNIINPIGWNFSKDQLFNVSHHKNTLSFLQVDGWLDFTFNGYRVDYYAETFESYGIAGVSVDSGPETMVDLYAPQEINNSTLVFTADSLKSDTTHTIRIRYTKQRNPNSNNNNARITFDKFIVYQHQGNYYPPPSTDTTKKAATQQYEQPKSSN